jgi:sulfur carrier protein ThiS
MTATVRPFGILKSYIDNQHERLVEPGRTVRQTMLDLGIPPDVVALVTVNDEPEMKDYVIREGDLVKLIAVVGGG